MTTRRQALPCIVFVVICVLGAVAGVVFAGLFAGDGASHQRGWAEGLAVARLVAWVLYGGSVLVMATVGALIARAMGR